MSSSSPELPEVRCAACCRLLFKGKMEGEIKCRCGYLMRFGERRKVIDKNVISKENALNVNDGP